MIRIGVLCLLALMLCGAAAEPRQRYVSVEVGENTTCSAVNLGGGLFWGPGHAFGADGKAEHHVCKVQGRGGIVDSFGGSFYDYDFTNDGSDWVIIRCKTFGKDIDAAKLREPKVGEQCIFFYKGKKYKFRVQALEDYVGRFSTYVPDGASGSGVWAVSDGACVGEITGGGENCNGSSCSYTGYFCAVSPAVLAAVEKARSK